MTVGVPPVPDGDVPPLEVPPLGVTPPVPTLGKPPLAPPTPPVLAGAAPPVPAASLGAPPVPASDPGPGPGELQAAMPAVSAAQYSDRPMRLRLCMTFSPVGPPVMCDRRILGACRPGLMRRNRCGEGAELSPLLAGRALDRSPPGSTGTGRPTKSARIVRFATAEVFGAGPTDLNGDRRDRGWISWQAFSASTLALSWASRSPAESRGARCAMTRARPKMLESIVSKGAGVSKQADIEGGWG